MKDEDMWQANLKEILGEDDCQSEMLERRFEGIQLTVRDVGEENLKNTSSSRPIPHA